ncbi:hypothetical protein IAR55_005769 [Kwoniella newhampshirensis]|uniref:Golgi to ER traffic protein 2 n=1 Tax=Kwoniella newhampshirensis TaxID=1651941 RepID=A0AAW0YGR1_9TREE
MSEAPQSEAARRAAARKAKILARGNTGLAKLAQTARGDEAQGLYGDDAKPSNTSTPISETPPSTSQPSWAPPPPSSSSSRPAAPQGISPEQQAMSAQLEAMMSMFGGPPGLGAGGGGVGPGSEGVPDMSRLLAQMMGGDPSSFGGPGGGGNLLGDVDDPAGLGGGAGVGGIPPNLFGPSGTDGFPSFPGMPGLGGAAAKPRSKAEKYFPLVHFVSIIVLSIFAVAWWEPALFKISPSSLLSTWSRRWAGLSGRRDSVWRLHGFGEPDVLPLFWAFTTLELILQTTRFVIFKSPPPPHSLLATFLPLMPPAISRPLLTGSRYLNLLSQTYKDGCLLVFGIGMTVVIAEWLRG